MSLRLSVQHAIMFTARLPSEPRSSSSLTGSQRFLPMLDTTRRFLAKNYLRRCQVAHTADRWSRHQVGHAIPIIVGGEIAHKPFPTTFDGSTASRHQSGQAATCSLHQAQKEINPKLCSALRGPPEPSPEQVIVGPRAYGNVDLRKETMFAALPEWALASDRRC